MHLTEVVAAADDLGFGTIWVGEAYGIDAPSTLGWIAGKARRVGVGSCAFQMTARPPTVAAMTAASLDDLAPGGFRLGLGASGPQVVEGWHGVAYGKPLARTREYVDVVRQVLRREGPVEAHGTYYDLPYTGDDGTGLGKALKLIGRAHPDIPVYVAASGPKNIALATQIGDGWLPSFFNHRLSEEMYGSVLDEAADGFDVVPTATVVLGDDLEQCRRPVKEQLALYLGGMGARGKNFHFDLAVRYGFGDAAATIQQHYLAGRKSEAADAVPDQLVDEVALCGPAGRVTELVHEWKSSRATSLAIATTDIEAMKVVREAMS